MDCSAKAKFCWVIHSAFMELKILKSCSKLLNFKVRTSLYWLIRRDLIFLLMAWYFVIIVVYLVSVLIYLTFAACPCLLEHLTYSLVATSRATDQAVLGDYLSHNLKLNCYKFQYFYGCLWPKAYSMSSSSSSLNCHHCYYLLYLQHQIPFSLLTLTIILWRKLSLCNMF